MTFLTALGYLNPPRYDEGIAQAQKTWAMIRSETLAKTSSSSRISKFDFFWPISASLEIGPRSNVAFNARRPKLGFG
jgi:hypothetical protein